MTQGSALGDFTFDPYELAVFERLSGLIWQNAIIARQNAKQIQQSEIIIAKLTEISEGVRKVAVTFEELDAAITSLEGAVDLEATQIEAKIAGLEEIIRNGSATEEQIASAKARLEALQAKIAGIVPDEPAPAPEPAPADSGSTDSGDTGETPPA